MIQCIYSKRDKSKLLKSSPIPTPSSINNLRSTSCYKKSIFSIYTFPEPVQNLYFPIRKEISTFSEDLTTNPKVTIY